MKISICGDLCPMYVSDLFERGDVVELFGDVTAEFENSDCVIVNLECALTDSERKIKKIGPNLKASPRCAELLKKIGVTDCALANNHVYDYGVQGLTDTINAVSGAGLRFTGIGENENAARRNLIISLGSKKIAVINVCEHEYCYALEGRMGTRAFDVFDTMEDIRAAKAENDFVIVLYHGGKEQSVYPSPRLRRACRSMVKCGADAVLCQHSHCIGCFEEFMGGKILYGQGNFHFRGLYDEHPHWQSGLIVQLEIDDELHMSFVPVVVRGDFGIELAKGRRRTEIMEEFEKRCADLSSDRWLEGWRSFCGENAEKYFSVIRKAYADDAGFDENEMFAHYLRCEAHLDVWNELCRLSWETRKEA